MLNPRVPKNRAILVATSSPLGVESRVHDCEIHRLRQRIDASPHEKDKRRIGYGPKQTRIAGIVDGEDRYVLALVSAQLFDRLFDEIVPICCDMSRVSCPNCLFDFGAAGGCSFSTPTFLRREGALTLQCRAITGR